MNEMIFTDNLGKQYRDLVALEGLSLRIPPGEIFGLLGPNGAGKTTTIKILTTLARPSWGMARIHDFDVVRQPLQVKKLIGVCPQEINLDRELTAFENLWIYVRLHRMADLQARIATLLEFGNLQERAHSLVRDFSGGMQRRLLISGPWSPGSGCSFWTSPRWALIPRCGASSGASSRSSSWRASLSS
jgi:ABC-2 type transport system ATP-binding protein